ncbi:MAG TPA: hypothetical protein VGS08_00945 [Candidatus Saccharimonadales bacterium]|nr:hypothetical protein [Candidatus Saccharimonadales bacterium]
MIQFNLLPDIKLQYVRAKHQEHLVIVVSTFLIIFSVAVLVILISIVDIAQKTQLNNLRNSVKTGTTKLQNTADLSRILTVQGQLSALPALHDAKPAVSRLVTYLTELTPTKATVGQLKVDYIKNTINITGSADSLATVNQFTDTLKFTAYSTQSQSAGKPAFSNVVLSNFSDSSNAGTTYTITANFDPAIFAQTNSVTLSVPGVINTRSQVAQPGVLFVQSSS